MKRMHGPLLAARTPKRGCGASSRNSRRRTRNSSGPCVHAVRRRLPTANELVWDNYNFFVIGYSPTERPSDSVLSIAARANGVGLCFIYGAKLPDPKKVLQGSGSQTRFLRLESADVLGRPEVEALVAAAIARARTPYPAEGRGRLIIRSVSARQRPRRRPAK